MSYYMVVAALIEVSKVNRVFLTGFYLVYYYSLTTIRHQSPFMVSDDDLNDLIGNVKLSDYFHTLAKDLDVLASKTPEDIYKSHLAEGAGFSRRSYTGGVQIDSARANLASTFVNGFVNAG